MPDVDRRAVLCVDTHAPREMRFASTVARRADLEEAARTIERIYADAVDDEAADNELAAIIDRQRAHNESANAVRRVRASSLA